MRIGDWFLLLILMVFFSVGIGYTVIKKQAIQKCSVESNAVIIDKYRKKKRGWFIRYRYNVDDREYDHSQPIKKKWDMESLNVGDTISIHYACDKHSISKYESQIK